MKAPSITCPQCEGSGKVELGLELQETLAALKELKQATPAQLYGKLGNLLNPTTANRRLETLRELGFAKRVRSGKAFVYSPAK